MWRKIVNPMMMALLRSPLHFLVSGRVMLISVRGRKTGKTYTTPVDYGRDGGAVLAVTSRNYAWWKNLRGGGWAELVLAGKRVMGRATVSEDEATIREAYRRLYPGRDGFEAFVTSSVAIRVETAG